MMRSEDAALEARALQRSLERSLRRKQMLRARWFEQRKTEAGPRPSPREKQIARMAALRPELVVSRHSIRDESDVAIQPMKRERDGDTLPSRTLAQNRREELVLPEHAVPMKDREEKVEPARELTVLKRRRAEMDGKARPMALDREAVKPCRAIRAVAAQEDPSSRVKAPDASMLHRPDEEQVVWLAQSRKEGGLTQVSRARQTRAMKAEEQTIELRRNRSKNQAGQTAVVSGASLSNRESRSLKKGRSVTLESKPKTTRVAVEEHTTSAGRKQKATPKGLFTATPRQSANPIGLRDRAPFAEKVSVKKRSRTGTIQRSEGPRFASARHARIKVARSSAEMQQKQTERTARRQKRDIPSRPKKPVALPIRLAPSRVPMHSAPAATTLAARPAAATVPDPSLFPRPVIPALPRLHTTNCFVLDDLGETRALRGTTLLGLDSVVDANSVAGILCIDQDNLSLMRDVYRFNVVRIPFQAQTVLSGNSSVTRLEFLKVLDEAITTVASAGLYVILALQAPAPAFGPPQPDDNTAQAWRLLASRYQEANAVLYELFSSESPLAANWKQQAATLIGAIRSEHPASVILVSGGLGGVDVSHLPLLFPTGEAIFNLIYTIQIIEGNAPLTDDGNLRTLAAASPIFATTWSDSGDGDRLAPHIADLIGSYGLGWTAANWNAAPRLIADAANHDFTASKWGLVAARAAALPIRNMLEPFSYPEAKEDPR
jgi:hypothetical protein